MRVVYHCLALLTLALFPPVAQAAAAVELVRVWPQWRSAESFERISDYFGSDEARRGDQVVRTQPAQRTGFYFLVRLKSATALPGARCELHIIRPDTPEPKVHTFAVSIPAKESVFELGLTGTDWPIAPEVHPVAWKLAVRDGEGRTLVEHKSFLWEKPAK